MSFKTFRSYNRGISNPKGLAKQALVFTGMVMMINLASGELAYAQLAGGGGDLFQPLSTAASSVLTFMTGTFAVTVATIVVAGLGYAMFQGMVPWGRALAIIGGIIFIFGAAAIVKSLSQGLGTTTMLMIDHAHMLA